MVLKESAVTAEAFEQFIHEPQNADKRFELINGRIVEMVSNDKSSEFAAFILGLLMIFVRQHKLGRITGADGGYIVNGQRLIPDVAFISYEKKPKPESVAYYPVAPDLAVEVLSPSDQPADVSVKLNHYQKSGTTIWLIDPEAKRVEIYRPQQTVVILGESDTLKAEGLLDGFTLSIKDIFNL
ncbi:MAG: Uma2 family endonuclease [Chloroflexota bacterium]